MSSKAKKGAVVIEPRFGSINDLQNDIEREIAAIKSGDLSESKARIVAKNRDLQIRTVELMLAAARIEAKFRPALSQALGLPPSKDKAPETPIQ